jgi:peptide/nickel transport system substrate-binding protein
VPYLDSIEYLAGADAAVVTALLKTQELDLAAIRTAEDVTYFASQSNVNIQDTVGVLVGNWGLFFNVTIAPFSDKRLREAVHLVINRQDLIDIAYGGMAYLSGPLGANSSLGHWSVDQLGTFPGMRADKTADVARAKQLLQDAGVANGFSFNVSFRGAALSDEAKIVQQELALYGIEMKEQSTQNASYERTEFAADKQATWVTEGGGTTPDHSITNTFLRDAPKNASNWFNDDMEALYLKQLATSDTAERFKLIDQAQQMVWDDFTAAWTVRPTTAWVSWGWVKNFATPDHGYQMRASQLDEIWIDRG